MLRIWNEQEVIDAGVFGFAILIFERRWPLHGLAWVNIVNEQRTRYLDPHKHMDQNLCIYWVYIHATAKGSHSTVGINPW